MGGKITFRFLLIILFLMGALIPGANAITFDLAFSGAKLIPENGVYEGSDLGGISIPNSYPIPEILEFDSGAVLGYYGGDRNFGVDTVGWGGAGYFDTVTAVKGGNRGLSAFADYLEYTHPYDGDLRRRNAFITDTVPTDDSGNFRGPGAVSNVVAFNFLLPVYDLNFYALDIDAPNEALAEKFVAKIYDDNGLLASIEVLGTNDSIAGDNVATYIDFTQYSGITRLETQFFRREILGDGSYGDYTVAAGGGGIDWMSFDADPAPVPEPATMLLLGTGLVGLAGVGRRKLKAKK